MTPNNYKQRIATKNKLELSAALIVLIEQIEIIKRNTIKLDTTTAYCEGKRIACDDILHIINTLI